MNLVNITHGHVQCDGPSALLVKFDILTRLEKKKNAFLRHFNFYILVLKNKRNYPEMVNISRGRGLCAVRATKCIFLGF